MTSFTADIDDHDEFAMTLVSICLDTSSSVPSCVTTIAGGSDALMHILERILIIPQSSLISDLLFTCS